MARNYDATSNPFGLLPPPVWWLQELALFDPQLIVFPGQKRATYLLARRATRSWGELLHDVPGLPQHPDTVLLSEHHCVRVCEIVPGTTWDMRIFQKLAAHDIQRLGGPSEVAYQLERQDTQRAETLERDQASALTARGSDGYKAYKTRIGERLSLAKSQPRGTVTPNPVSVAVPAPFPPAQPSSRLPGPDKV